MAGAVVGPSSMRRDAHSISFPALVVTRKPSTKKAPPKSKNGQRRASNNTGAKTGIKRVYSSKDSFEFRKRIDQYKQWQKEHVDGKLKIFKDEIRNAMEQEAMRVSKTIVHIETSLKHTFSRKVVEEIRPTHVEVSKKVPMTSVKGHTERLLSGSSVKSEQIIDRKLLLGKEKEEWILKWLEEVEAARETCEVAQGGLLASHSAILN